MSSASAGVRPATWRPVARAALSAGIGFTVVFAGLAVVALSVREAATDEGVDPGPWVTAVFLCALTAMVGAVFLAVWGVLGVARSALQGGLGPAVASGATGVAFLAATVLTVVLVLAEGPRPALVLVSAAVAALSLALLALAAWVRSASRPGAGG